VVSACNRNSGCGEVRKILDVKIFKKDSLAKQCVDGNKILYSKPQDNRI
jgi:hypothetical protein